MVWMFAQLVLSLVHLQPFGDSLQSVSIHRGFCPVRSYCCFVCLHESVRETTKEGKTANRPYGGDAESEAG